MQLTWETTQRRIWFWFGLAAIVAAGSALRLHLLADQVLLDDEWHGLVIASRKSFSQILALTSLGATSPLSNLYYWVLLRTVGWTATLIRLPQLVAGVAATIILPLYVLRLFGRKIALVFAVLLSISPFLVFYSRNSRPYSTTMLFGFLALLHFYLWITEGRRRDAVLYVLAGFLSACYFPGALLVTGMPLVLAAVIATFKPRTLAPNLTRLVAAGTVLAVTSAFVYTAVIMKNPWMMRMLKTPALPEWDRLVNLSILLSGTHHPFLVLLFLALAVAGGWQLVRSRPFLALSLFPGSLSALAIAAAVGNREAIVLARYSVILYPVLFLCVAVAVASLDKRRAGPGSAGTRPGLGPAAIACGTALFLAMLWVKGPLARNYRQKPNNFLNHSAFQETYRRRPWDEHSYVSAFLQDYGMSREEVPDYYNQLEDDPDVDTILEYPMLVGDAFNLFYYYQRFHGKRVVLGYTDVLSPLRRRRKNFAYASDTIDTVLSLPVDQKQLRFRNMVPLLDFKSVLDSGADRIIFHWNLFGEMGPRGKAGRSTDAPILELVSVYHRVLGQPEYVDEDVVVFRVDPEAMIESAASLEHDDGS